MIEHAQNRLLDRVRRFTGMTGFVLVLAGVAFGLATFAILTGMTPITPTSENTLLLMLLNGAVLLVLALLILGQILFLLIERRNGTPGASLQLRLVSLFSVIAVVPAIVVAIFATVTLNRGLVTTLIDINKNLPNGTPNPNFLQPYSEANRQQNPRGSAAHNIRGAVAYVKDTRFGDFKFNSLFGTNVQDNLGRLTLLGARLDPDPRRWSLTDLIRYRYYWNQAGRPLPQLGKVQLVDPVLGTTREVTPAYTYDTSRPEVNANTKATYRYALGSVNGQFFKRRLIVLGAFRADDGGGMQYYTLPTGNDTIGVDLDPEGRIWTVSRTTNNAALG